MAYYFKGDARELQVYNSIDFALNIIQTNLIAFFQNAYGCVPMGALLYDEMRFPLTNAIRRDVFIRCFKELLDAWKFAGTFATYISVFKKIFGDDVIINFTVPGPGRLQIAIESSGLELSPWRVNSIVDNDYVYDTIVDDEGDNIVFSTVLGFETENELEVMLTTTSPDGIHTEVSLTIGS